MFKGHKDKKKSSEEGRGGVMGEREEVREGWMSKKNMSVPSRMIHL